MYLRSLNLLKSVLRINNTKSSLDRIIRFSSFAARDFFYDDSHGESGTLNTRFVKYIAMECNKHDEIINQTIKYADYFPINDMHMFSKSLNQIPTEQLPRLIIFAYTYKSNADQHKFAQALNEIDRLCVHRIDEFSLNGLLTMLYAFMYLIPNKITYLDFYKFAVHRLIQNFNLNSPKETFVQICYYLGLWKKNHQSTELMRNFLKNHLNHYLTKLNKIDFAVIANAAFKTSVIQLNEDFNKRLIQEILNCDYTDDALLITFVKSLRIERIKSLEVYEKLKSLLIDGKLKKYEFKGLVHIFALYSDGLWNDSQVCEIISKECMKRLQEIGANDEQPFNDVREKDIATFLWCISNLRCNQILNETDLQFIEEVILRRIQCDKYKYCPDELVDAVLSLWMMDYKSKRLIEEIQNLNKMNSKLRRNERIKLDSRLKLLMNCVQIEKPEWLTGQKSPQKSNVFNENRKAPEYLLKNRENLNKLSEFLTENKQRIGIKSINKVAPVDELNIANILIEMDNESKVHVEALENAQMLKFDDREIILVQLKLRLLKALGCHVILIKPKELEEENSLLHKLSHHIDENEESK